MRVTSMLPDVQAQLQQTKQGLATALQQLSTGKRVNQLSDDPAASASMVRSLAASADVDRYTKSISTLVPQMQSADAALSAVVTSLNSAITMGTSGANGTNTASNRAQIATQVQGLLSSVVAQANTSYQGQYLFGGTVSSTPPFVQASASFQSTAGSSSTPLSLATPLATGATTTISDAGTGQSFTFKAAAGDTLGTLQAAINGAVTAGTLSQGTSASINSSGNLEIDGSASAGIYVSSTDPAVGSMQPVSGTQVSNSYAYVGNNNSNSVAVGNSLSVNVGVSGSQAFASSSGNVFSALRNLIGALQGNDQTAIGTATSQVTAALGAVSQARVPLGSTVNQLNSQETYLAQDTITLSTAQTSLVGIDLSEAATNLSQAQLAQSATLAAAAKAVPQTLLDYLK
jgi:flagellar hook-associated protein 3